MFQTAVDTEADLLIISEPFRRCGDESRWCFSEDRLSAVATTSRTDMTHDAYGSGNGFAWMSFRNLTVFSCYSRPGITIQEYSLFLSDFEAAIRGRGACEILVAGDFNAWSVEWGSRINNHRGSLLSDLVNSLGLTVVNTGSTPTFRRAAATSVIDVTFSRAVEIVDWRVLEADSLSDHSYVFYKTASQRLATHSAEPANNEHSGWSVTKRDDIALAEYFTRYHPEIPSGEPTVAKALASATAYDRYLVGACEASMPRRRPGPPRKNPVHWWSEEIADLRRKCLALRRRYQASLRHIDQPGLEECRTAYLTARRDLRRAIKAAKAKCWSELCDQVDHDPWGKPYRIVMKKFRSCPPGADSRGNESTIADFLFPAAATTNWDEAPSPVVLNIFEAFDPVRNTLEFTRAIPAFTSAELVRAAKRLTSGKSPGPSGIPNEIIKASVVRHQRTVLQVFNDCLLALTFPPQWKRARLVLIRKGPEKPADQPSSFRPICMLDNSVGVAKTGALLENAVNPVLELIDAWMREKGLELAHQKSEAVLLTRRRAYTPPNLFIGGHQIGLRPSLRYLGVFLDQRMTFSVHVTTVAKKAARSAAALSRLMSNTKGPCQSKRRLLASVVESQLLYAAPTWIDTAAASARTVRNLVRPQRAMALRIIRAYRTVSDEAALVLAGLPPADLLGMERKRIRARAAAPPMQGAIPPSKATIKRQERFETNIRWQARWASTTKGSWTRKLLPDLNRWLGRTVPKMPLSFHMTQALTGHGCFQQYLFKMGRANSPQCTLCYYEDDTAEHTLFDCVYFAGLREELGNRLGHQPSIEDIPAILCGPEFESLPTDDAERNSVLRNAEEDFRLFYKMVEEIMTLKEDEERRRQAGDGRR
ncbi:hypothetical protein AGLY_006425 [Aphis glycines]|uniref:Endonuclease/exonuclease/phosphatase domain-containing protein n=1 Tax=Aphis glycines TaxID=307491 RepID=A0A6G0TRK3_APHGL|nr:hypothetical protein AGLY_006425 [Aphis glycines]